MPVYKARVKVDAVVDYEVQFNAEDLDEAYRIVQAMPSTGELELVCENAAASPTGNMTLLEMLLVSAEGTLTEEGVVSR